MSLDCACAAGTSPGRRTPLRYAADRGPLASYAARRLAKSVQQKSRIIGSDILTTEPGPTVEQLQSVKHAK